MVTKNPNSQEEDGVLLFLPYALCAFRFCPDPYAMSYRLSAMSYYRFSPPAPAGHDISFDRA